jgi:hypothetical protein
MRLFIFLSIFVFLISCAQVPKQESHFLSYQEKLQASKHWNLMAKKIADQTKIKLESQSELDYATASLMMSSSDYGHAYPDEPESKLEKKSIEDEKLEIGLSSGKGPVYIHNNDNSQFGSIMHTLLTTELMDKGIAVSRNPKSLYKLSWNVQIVRHKADRINKGGLLSFILIEIPQFIFFGENDFGEYKPHSEVVITFKLKRDNINLFRDTDIYYVNDLDNNHYWDIAEYTDDELTKSATFTLVNQ